VSLLLVTNDAAIVSLVEQLNSAYKKETDADIKERLLLMRRVKLDGMEASKVAEKELSRTRWWAYKWLRGFNEHGLEGLKDHQRSGRPPKISEKRMHRIKQKVIENPSGWQVKQVMDLIYKNTGIRYHEVHVRRMLHQWGMSPKVPQKRFVNTASPEEKADFKKEYWIHSQKYQKGSP
jgi:transposase